MGTENKDSCSQRDSAEREGYVRAHRSFRRIWKERDSAQPELLEEILEKGNLNRAFKRVKANKGAPGIDGITMEEIGAYLRMYALSDFLIMVLSWLVKQSLRAFSLQEVQP